MKVDLTEKQINAILYAISSMTCGDWKDTGKADRKEGKSLFNILKTIERRLSMYRIG